MDTLAKSFGLSVRDLFASEDIVCVELPFTTLEA